jgi:putative hydrolase of HD superfamily
MLSNENINAMYGMLDFMRRAEALKSTLRTTWTRSGRQESTAEHSWRLCLFAMLTSREYPELNALKILQLCIVHDLGEAINGDIPAPEQNGSKDEQEREDMIDLLRPLPEKVRKDMLFLWEEYEYAKTPEARLVKALDKLETLLQHGQGANPLGAVDYAFNLDYGAQYTELDEFISELRTTLDLETESCLIAQDIGHG